MGRRIVFAFIQLALCTCAYNLKCLCEAPYNLAPECFRPECSGDNIVCATNRQFLEQIRQVVFISHCLHSSVNSNVTVLCSRSTTRCCSTDLCNRDFHSNDSAFDIVSTPTTSPTSMPLGTQHTSEDGSSQSSTTSFAVDRSSQSSITPFTVGSSEQITVPDNHLRNRVVVTATICIILLFISIILILGVAALAYYYLVARTDKVSAAKKQQAQQVSGHSSILPTFCKSNLASSSNHSDFFRSSEGIISPTKYTGSTSTTV